MFNKLPVNPAHGVQAELATGMEETLHRVMLLLEEEGRPAVLALDGTHGADFDGFADALAHHLSAHDIAAERVPASRYLRSTAELRERFADNITDNRAFGYMVEADIADYYRADARERWQAELSGSDTGGGSGEIYVMKLLYGPGAGWLCEGSAPTLFLDLSRESQQRLHQGTLGNFGFDDNRDALEKYKIAFFVEWPILEGYRKQLLPTCGLYLDMNDPVRPVAVSVGDLRRLLRTIAMGPLRVKPFFAPGVWGGQYLKRLAALPEDWANCAWSFEPIAPENSLLIGCAGHLLEVPFTLVMQEAYANILGERVSGLFGDYFPIRFDYLDTIGGSNLSVQVHPKQAYIEEVFNYPLEQQESYYIMEQEPGAKVYLGLTDSCTEQSFLGEVEQAQATGEPFDFACYVQEWEAAKGDLFLIPTGTVHCSGSGNLVLEISATTWWFTFKIYDYVRRGLDGQPRPINIDHAAANIDWHKSADWVGRELIARPRELSRQSGGVEYELGQRDDLLFYVHRLHLTEVWEDDTAGELQLLNLVEGERARLVPLADPGRAVEFGYAESYIVPATTGRYAIINLGAGEARIIKAGVSPRWDRPIRHD